MIIMDISWIIFVVVLVTMIDISYQASKTRPHIYPHVANEDYNFWMRNGKKELDVALERIYQLRGEKDSSKLKRPKNVLFFVGDGMSLTTVTAARIYRGQQQQQRSGEELLLSWEEFPETALLKTYNVDRQTPDSAATATALFSGSKTNFYTLGYDSNIRLGSAKSAKNAKQLTSILDWGQSAGKRTGIVTTARLTHATPAALYAHSPHRYWECDAGLKRDEGYGPSDIIAPGEDNPNYNDTLDIARQLIYDETGKRTNVILGGGLRGFKQIEGVKKSKWTCVREDGRDLTMEWKASKEKEGVEYAFVRDTKELRNVNTGNIDYLLGIFADSHLDYEYARNKSDDGQPSISEMTTTALSVLTNPSNKNGFVLVVEGGRIDHAHHQNYANRAMEETVAMHKAVQDSLDYLEKRNMLDETLIIVTSDHSHVMTMMGYAKRGTDIRGLTGDLTDENMEEPILSYANGQGVNNIYSDKPDPESGKCQRKDLKQEDFLSMDHRAPAMIFDYDEHHGGDDVVLWAKGPMSYLFHKTHEQSYVAHVIGYSMCIGPYANSVECRHNDGDKWTWTNNSISLISPSSAISYLIFVQFVMKYSKFLVQVV